MRVLEERDLNEITLDKRKCAQEEKLKCKIKQETCEIVLLPLPYTSHRLLRKTLNEQR